MVTKIITGKNMRGALNYNEQKVREHKAVLLTAEGFVKDTNLLSFSDKLNRFLNLMERNERVKTNTVHISLNFSTRDQLDDELLKQITGEYLEKIGFGEQPYLLYRHDDTAHPHCHVLTTNIQKCGQRIDLHNIGRNQSEQARKAIEIKYGLTKAEEQREEIREFKRLKAEPAIYGKNETKRSISSLVTRIVKEYNYTSFFELNAVLMQYGVVADRGNERSKMFANKGLRYSMLNENRIKVGVPVKASAIYSKPTLINLERRFEEKKLHRNLYKTALKARLKKIINEQQEQGLVKLSERLKEHHIVMVIRQNDQGRIYGLTYIDTLHKSVFNGSELGRDFSAQGIIQQFGEDREDKKQLMLNKKLHDEPSFAMNFTDKSRQEVSELVDILIGKSQEDDLSEFEKRKRKKRKLKL